MGKKNILYTYCQWLLLIYALILYCFSPVFSNDFLLGWDDQWMVMNQYTENGYSWSNIWQIFSQPINGQYSPLVELNFLLLYNLCGYNPFWFHVMSVIWHCGCVTLLFIFVRKILDKNEDDSPKALKVAWLTSLMFAIHPVNVESVAWISAVKVPMYAFFYLFSLLMYFDYVISKRRTFYISSIIFFSCSCLSKEQAIMLPLSLLLVDWFVGRSLKLKDTWFDKIPFFIISIFLVLLTFNLQNNSNTVSYTILRRIVFGCYSLFEYITKSLIPINLNYLYPYPIMGDGNNLPLRFYLYPFLVVLLFIWLMYDQKKRIFLWGFLFFIFHLFPFIHIIPIPRLGITADRYLYLSLVGLLMPFSYWIVSFCENLQYRLLYKVGLGVLVVLYCSYLGGYTKQYSQKWENVNSVKGYLRSFIKENG